MKSLGDIKPGQSIGRYEFLIPIAEGGMASVWAARMVGSRGFQKTLAIKMMLSSLSDNPQFEEMFLDEARIASQISHPNVVEILDLGEENDVLYLVMEWVDGEPLSTVFRTARKRKGIPIGVAVRIIADACAGLNAAHDLCDDEGDALGLVHRDISPQNILVTYDGNVKIVDFGVAKAAGRESEKTSAGTVKGKAPYMSPEQALGKDIDRRTDIFAMGIVLYQLCTLKHPFRGESDLVTLHNIIEKACPPPSSIVPGFPRPLEAVIMKALDKNPDKRFQTAAEMEAALDRVMPPTAPRVRAADVARFVRDLVGERGKKRRDALKSAIRLADDHTANAAEIEQLAQRPMAEIGLTGPVGAVSMPSGAIAQILGPDGRPSITGLPSGGQPITLLPPPSQPPGVGPGSNPPITTSSPSVTGIATGGVANSMHPPSAAQGGGGSKKGIAIGIAVAAVAASLLAFAATRNTGDPVSSSPAGANPAPPATSEAKPAEPAPTKAAEPAPKPKASDPNAVDLSTLPDAKKKKNGGGGGKKTASKSGGGGGAKTPAPAKTTPKPKTPPTKKAGGKVYKPPAMSDPGF